MMYLIGQLGFWLLLTGAFAAVAGWAMASGRAADVDERLQRERDGLVRDLSRLAGGETTVDVTGAEREADSMRRLLDVRDGRIAELEGLLSAARSRADEAASRIAELERAPAPNAAENEELSRLRALAANYESERAREVHVEAAPVVEDEQAALRAWRLRYFEQRVKYLETKAAEPAPAPEVVEGPAEPPVLEWRARDAEAQAAHLATELRALQAAPQEAPVEAFAANAEVDMMLRWRMLYLERRAAYLQESLAKMPELEERAQRLPLLEQRAQDLEQTAHRVPAMERRIRELEAELSQAREPDPMSDRWKWRSRYLEARVRHLELRPGSKPQAVAAPVVESAPSPAPSREKPATLPAARNGAPDDFTLIEDVSVLQQTTLYSLGVFHFDQIAAWSPSNVAWVDNYLRLRGRIDDEEWVEQARALARDGVRASWRLLADEEA